MSVVAFASVLEVVVVFPLEVLLHLSAELSHGAASEASPLFLRSSVFEEDVFGGFSVRHRL